MAYMMMVIVGIYVFFAFAVIAVFYVLHGISHMRALRALGYDRPWMAWIPFASDWALAEVTLNGAQNIIFFESYDIPAMVFQLWWLIAIGISCVPVVGTLLNVVLRIICLGTCYIKMYARLEGTGEKEQQVIGYISGFFPLIASCKFLTGKYND